MPKDEFERRLATIEFLENREVREGILRGLQLQDYKAGRSRRWREAREHL